MSAGSFNWALNCKESQTCGYTMFGGEKYYVLNIHMHSPSEHWLNGKQYPLEAHIVHLTPEGKPLVIATMFETYDADAYPVRVYENANMLYGTNPFLKSILNNVAKGKQEFPVHLGSIIDASKGYCSYVGSLTTPPCTEGVTFMMAQKVQMMNPKQAREYLRTAGACVDGNARPIQELNGRQVTCYIK
eukprot:GO255613.1.p1 GENE.GO255613.1~~GO255613.1.p1  ORF type:complete len:188 (-),score=63.96 GO255613.1:155-718(-)